MPTVPPRSVPGWKLVALISICALLFLSGVAPVSAFHASATLRTTTLSHVPPSAVAAPAAPRPSANLSITGYTNNTFYNANPASTTKCITPYCFPQAQNPTTVNLPNGEVGTGYSVMTTLNNTNLTDCPAAPPTVSRVAFMVSPDNGSTYGLPTYLSTPAAVCEDVQQVEPTFAVSSGHVWAAYVATNATPLQLMGSTTYVGYPPVLPWVNRGYDGIALVNSTSNGTSFGTANLVLDGSNYADPILGAYGKTLYIVYENISNGTSPLPSSSSPPISIQLVYSTDLGVTWNGPYFVPGQNSSQSDTAMGPSLAINSGGTIAVSYATNRTCIAFCTYGSYSTSGDDIVVATSALNGTSWLGPHRVAAGQGEIPLPYPGTQGPTGSPMYGLFEDAPLTTLTWGTGPDLYVAWEAAPNLNTTATPSYFYDYSRVAIYAGDSVNGGLSWTWAAASPGLDPLVNIQGIFGEDWFNPAIGFHGGTVYLTYSYENWSNLCGYLEFGTSYTESTYTQWLTTSTNGHTYAPPQILFLSTPSYGLSYYHYMGNRASVAFSSGGSPVVAYSLANGWFVSYPVLGSYSMLVSLSVSTVSSLPSTPIVVAEGGLTAGTVWSFSLDGLLYTTNRSAVNVTGLPAGAHSIISWPGPATPVGYRAAIMPVIDAGPFFTVTSGLTIDFNFTTFYGVQFSPSPNDYYLSVQFANYGAVFPYQFQFTWDTYLSGTSVYYQANGCAMPWYFPAGTHFTLAPVFSYPVDSSYYTQQFVGYWNGTGSGSYTGPGSWGNLTVSSPFNESLWDLGISSYSEQFTPIGLPATSTYSFNVDGTPYSAAGTTSVVVPNLVTGPHWVTNVSANSTVAGWSYFGASQGGNPLLVPIQPDDNLTFAFVNTSAPQGTVTFHAVGVTPGSPWHLDFNGTEYSSNTPWINVTTRPGTFAVGAGNVVSANGTAALTPTGFGPTLSVTPALTYDINFTATYKLSVLASLGGTIAPAGGSFWVAPSTFKNLTATPASGFTFGGWSGSGPGSYTGANVTATVQPTGPVVEAASFVPQAANRFNLSVSETGLPAGTEWTVYLNGVGYTSNQSSYNISNLYSCAISGNLGNYGAFVPTLGASSGTEYVPGGSTPTTACVTRPFVVAFSTSYSLTVAATAGGSVTGATVGNETWVPSGSAVVLGEVAEIGYNFLGWVGTGPGSVTSLLSSITVSPTGPVTELAVWGAVVPTGPAKYTVSFAASAALPATASWAVEFNGTLYSTSSGPVVISGVTNGTYAYSVPVVGGAAAGTRDVPSPSGTSVHVGGAAVNVPVPFTAEYWVDVSGVGAGTVGPASGWFASGKAVVLNASPVGTALFEGWAGAGNGWYSGPSQGPTIRVLGPITEKATFVAPPSSTTPTTSSSASPSTLVIAALAILGLIVGVVVGLLLARRGRPPANSSGDPASMDPPTREENA